MARQLILLGSVLIILANGLSVHAQNGMQLDKLTSDFKSDSLGCLGLRTAHITTVPVTGDSTRTEAVLIDGQDLVGRTEGLVWDILGRPNKSQYRHHNRGKGKQTEMGHLWYYLNDCDPEAHQRTLAIFVANGRVEEVMINEQQR